MPSHPREMITMAERRFPVRIRIGVPPGGFGQRHTNITAWLDENCGADGWVITPSGVRGVLNDAVISSTPRSRARSSPAGAPGRWSKRMAACSVFAAMIQCRGPGQGCTERPEISENPGYSFALIRSIAAYAKCVDFEICSSVPKVV
jgi:hypothetical protein